MVHELCEQLSKHEQVKLAEGESGKIRVFEVSKDGKHQREFNANEMLGNLPETEIFAEVCSRVLFSVDAYNDTDMRV